MTIDSSGSLALSMGLKESSLQKVPGITYIHSPEVQPSVKSEKVNAATWWWHSPAGFLDCACCYHWATCSTHNCLAQLHCMYMYKLIGLSHCLLLVDNLIRQCSVLKVHVNDCISRLRGTWPIVTYNHSGLKYSCEYVTRYN